MNLAGRPLVCPFVLGEPLALAELAGTLIAAEELPVMHQPDVPVQVVLVPELHDAAQALELLLVGVRDHVTPQVRPPLEHLGATLECAPELPQLLVHLPDVAVHVRLLVEPTLAGGAAVV